jgi:hypothetical protein
VSSRGFGVFVLVGSVNRCDKVSMFMNERLRQLPDHETPDRTSPPQRQFRCLACEALPPVELKSSVLARGDDGPKYLIAASDQQYSSDVVACQPMR